MTTPTREALLDTIRQLADRAIPVVAQRNAAYAGGGDVFGNLNLIETLSSGDIRTETGIVIRMGDKVSRLYSLTARNAPENDESLEDTLVDLLGYSALLLLRHRTRNNTTLHLSGTSTTAGREMTPDEYDKARSAPNPLVGAGVCRKHAYSWDGTIPCTGSYRCVYCKKVADATALDYSKVVYDEPCPGRPA